MGFRRWDFLGLLGDVGNDVSALLGLLETSEGHLGSGHELLGVLEVDVKDLGGPDDARLGVGLGVGEALNGAGLTPDEAEEVGADAVGGTFGDGVALGGTSLEELETLDGVTGGQWGTFLLSHV